MNLDPTLAGYDAPRADAFLRLLEQRAQTLPGVSAASLTSFVPFSFESDSVEFASGTHKILFEPERIVLDGAELARVPREAKTFHLTISDAWLLTISGDGIQTVTKQLSP